jgi:cytochrome subunit of sulfide dehydrogenase
MWAPSSPLQPRSGAAGRSPRRAAGLIALPVVVCMALLGASGPAAAQDGQGARLAAICAACHRLDGRDAGIPPIVGLDRNSIVQGMLAYRSGERASQLMHIVASALSPAEIATVAQYLASLRKDAAR